MKTEMNWKKNLLTIILGIIAFIQLYPLIWLVLVSFKKNWEIFGGNVVGLPQNLIWQNYKSVFSDGHIAIYLLNSMIVTSCTIIISSIMAAMASYAIARMRWKLSNTTLTIFLLGLMIPLHAALLPLFLVFTKLNIRNSYLALIIPYSGFALPMAIFILTGFFKGLPKELEEAACIDGCNIYKTFYSIMLPLIKPAIATVAIFTYLSSWNELMFAVTFISEKKYKTLTVGVMSMVGQYTTNWGAIGAGLVIATLPTAVIYTLMSKQIQKSITAGALKG